MNDPAPDITLAVVSGPCDDGSCETARDDGVATMKQEVEWFDTAASPSDEPEPTPVFEADAEAQELDSTPPAESCPVLLPTENAALASEATPTPSPPPREEVANVDGPAGVAKAESRFRAGPALLGVLFVINAGLVAGLVALRREEHQARAPIAAMSVDVKEIRSQQAETRVELEETRVRLDKQALALTQTMESVAATERRQKEAEREAKEHAAREAKEMAALTARMNHVERRVDDEVYTIEEAVKIIDMVQGRTANQVQPTLPPAVRSPPAEAKSGSRQTAH
jgi:hypothetical protein